MTNEPDRRREAETVITTVAAALPAVYLASGSLTVTAMTSAVLIAVVISRRT